MKINKILHLGCSKSQTFLCQTDCWADSLWQQFAANCLPDKLCLDVIKPKQSNKFALSLRFLNGPQLFDFFRKQTPSRTLSFGTLWIKIFDTMLQRSSLSEPGNQPGIVSRLPCLIIRRLDFVDPQQGCDYSLWSKRRVITSNFNENFNEKFNENHLVEFVLVREFYCKNLLRFNGDHYRKTLASR